MKKYFFIFLLLCPLTIQAYYFASIKSNKANLRVGPGVNYPIDWIYIKKTLPVKVIDKYEQWRKIQDIDNTIGWIHQNLLTSKRYLIITEDTQIHSDGSKPSQVIAKIDARVIVKLKKCQNEWCNIEVQNIKGLINKDYIWGVE